ncbi:MAG: metalloregulator ArsR/SmtB family transcription factor [Desulfovibrionaceae bacterium]|nr:metalloregulator ArsR/SmtB family transcription factor [Desulfovibrionaceae bacterium]MBF0515285.1 metalloregulator ArsR/SmtB family transcription factor [Desulfovibrionaceae bacterium]
MDLLTYCKALSDETRLRLTRLLLRRELAVAEIVAVLGMGQSRISRHLKILADSGLISFRRDGLWVFYKARTDGAAGDFLRGITPFFEAAPVYADDLKSAADVLAERGRATTRLFNELAPGWNRLIREVLGDLDLPAAIGRVFPEAASAADLGCGAGALLPMLLGKASLVIGVDNSAKMLAEAKKRAAGRPVSLRMGDVEHLPLRDAEVEVAAASLVFHHLAEPLAAAREAYRVIAPGGTFVVADFLTHGDESLRQRMGDRWLGFTPEQMQGWLAEAGFTVTESQTIRAQNGLEVGIYVATKHQLGEHDNENRSA